MIFNRPIPPAAPPPAYPFENILGPDLRNRSHRRRYVPLWRWYHTPLCFVLAALALWVHGCE
jgi:hypothetical protein